MVPARCKLAYIRAGIIAIIGSAATGLISIEKVSNNPDEDSWIQEDVSETLPPHPEDCASAPREQNLHRYVISFYTLQLYWDKSGLWFNGCNRTSSWAKYSPFLCSANLKIHHFELFSYELSNITSISLLSSKARVKNWLHLLTSCLDIPQQKKF